MKKNLFYLFALILSVSLFSACSSSDDDGGVASEIAGTYDGTMSVEAPSGDESAPQSVVVQAVGDDQVKIQIASITILGVTINDVAVPCTVSKNGNNYTLTGSGTVSVFPVTVTGGVNGKALTLSIGVSTVGVTANFSGTKK